MTQPAKVQEPSMEEILASIRRIIADDEAMPADAAASAEVAPETMPMKTESPKPQTSPAQTFAPAPRPAAVEARPAAVLAASGGQNEIDAMQAGHDAATTPDEVHAPLPDGDVFELTDDMALPDTAPAFRKVEPQHDLEFIDGEEHPASAAASASARHAFEPYPRDPRLNDATPPGFRLTENTSAEAMPTPQILSQTTVSAVESAFNSLANTVLSNNARTLEDLVKEMLRPMLKNWLDDNLPGVVERIVKAEIERVSRGR